MLDSQQKRKINMVLYHKATLVVLSLVVLLVARSTWDVFQKKRESDELKNISSRYKDGLVVRNNELQAQMDRLGTEAGKEAEIRSKFSVAKDKENIVVIVNENPTPNQSTTTKNWWQVLMNLFKK